MSRPSHPAPDPWNWRPVGPARLEQSVALLRLEGPDTLQFLHGQSSQDLARTREGEWRGTCCISPTARMRALADVIVDGSGAWLVITGGDAGEVRRGLDRVLFPADRVRLGELREAFRTVPLPRQSGPMTTADGTWTPLEEGEGWWLGDILVRTVETPLPAGLAERRPLSAAEAERWRIQHGIPAAPSEINDDTNPFELGLADRVSLDKGCYVGQETLAKLATYDGVRRQLRRWCCAAAAGEPPGPQTVLLEAAGERAGVITSSLQLADGSGIGLALVRRRWLSEPLLHAAGDSPDERVAVSISTPEAFTPPPVGAGGSRPAGGAENAG